MPIRTAIVGLPASAKTSWASTAHLPSLLSSAGRERFNTTALLNSSKEAAQAAIAAYDLPPTVQAYGAAEALVEADDVDLVLVNTRVDKHFESAFAAISRGKECYIEWPIAANLQDVGTLVTAARDKNVRVAVGLQGRWAAPVLQMKALLQSGKFGKLLSSHVQAFGGTRDREALSEGLSYFTQLEVGGNPITIGFGHVIDFVQSVVGELDESTTKVRMQIQRPQVKLRDPKTAEAIETVESNVPDLVALQGKLQPSSHTFEDATLTMNYRRGQAFPGEPALTWTLNCERAEIRLTGPNGISLQADAYDKPVQIHVHDFKSDVVTDVTWDWDEAQKAVPVRASSVFHCLIAFADEDTGGYVSLEDAAARARQIDGWIKKATSHSA